MNIYLTGLFAHVIIFSILDFYTNKFYKKVWNKKKLKDKFLLILLLIFHNVIYYLIYFTLPYILYYYNKLDIKYLILYLSLVTYIPIHWYTNNNQCWFTLQQNNLLEIEKDYGFRDWYSIIFNKYYRGSGDMGLRDQIYYGYLFVSIFITSLLIILKYIK